MGIVKLVVDTLVLYGAQGAIRRCMTALLKMPTCTTYIYAIKVGGSNLT